MTLKSGICKRPSFLADSCIGLHTLVPSDQISVGIRHGDPDTAGGAYIAHPHAFPRTLTPSRPQGLRPMASSSRCPLFVPLTLFGPSRGAYENQVRRFDPWSEHPETQTFVKALFWHRKGRYVTKVKSHKAKATGLEAKAKVKAARKEPV